MIEYFSSLNLNGHHYETEELSEYCETSLERGNLPTWERDIYKFILDWISDVPYVVLQTSGSTGIPKVIRQSKEMMINSALMTMRYFKLAAGKNALLCLPVSYIAGKMMIVRAFVSRINLVITEPSANPFQFQQLKIDFTAITPYQLIKSLDTLNDAKVETVIVGGGEISYDLEMRCQDISSTIFATYGMTETSSHIAIRPVNGIGKSSIYEVLENTRISLDPRGCLVINAPHLTSETLITNDLVLIKDDYHFEWIGRFDNVINSGGVKIHPEQIEKKLSGLIDRRFFIYGLPDAILGEIVALFIEGDAFDDVENQNFTMSLHSLLPKFEIPRKVLFIQSFDLSESGKILKRQTVFNFQSL